MGGAFAQTPSAPATATPITKETKDEVMKEVNQIVTSVAFVPGVDFSKWNDFIDGEKPSTRRTIPAISCLPSTWRCESSA